MPAKRTMLGHLRALRPGDGFASLILAKGEWFYGRANADDYEIAKRWAKKNKPKAKDCYYNAQTFCIDCTADCRYLEGYVLLDTITPSEHAWVVMADGRIVDFTLEAAERKAKQQHKLVMDTSDALYFGVEVPRLFALEQIMATDFYDSVAELYHAPTLPDHTEMESFLQQLVANVQGHANQSTPLAKALSLMYGAFEQTDEKKRIQLAKEALAIYPDCADAYVLLAEHAPSSKEAHHLYEQGVTAGERALGAEAFQQNVGRFWSVLETRPYMRARLGLAEALWSAGCHEEAMSHLQDMLRLNPGDNQGVRYVLASYLLFLGRNRALARLLKQYDESSAIWEYTKALLAFRQHGDTPKARKLLTQAKKANRHVPRYLTGKKCKPFRQPAFYSPGDDNEALNYVGSFLAAWKSTPGAVAWLQSSTRRTDQGIDGGKQR